MKLSTNLALKREKALKLVDCLNAFLATNLTVLTNQMVRRLNAVLPVCLYGWVYNPTLLFLECLYESTENFLEVPICIYRGNATFLKTNY